MNAPLNRSRARHALAVAVATAWNFARRSYRYRIAIVQETMYPVLLMVNLIFAYQASGRAALAGYGIDGFLLVGAFGVIVWGATVWCAGFAVEHERTEGTIAAVMGTSASRTAIVLGYAMGSIVRLLPALASLALVAIVARIHVDVDDPAAALGALSALLFGSLCTGYALSTLFVAIRNAQEVATLLNFPMWLLSGALLPPTDLPAPLQGLAALVPMRHGLDAVRASVLAGGGWADVGSGIAWALIAGTAYLVVGRIGLAVAERRAQAAGTLDLF